MKQKIENLNKISLSKAFRRLKKATRGFSSLIVRDPLDYLDFEVNLIPNLDSLVFEVNSNNYHPQRPYIHLSAKSKGINRPTVIFDIKDALVYRFCIEQVEDELIKKTRQKNVRGGIKITSNKNSNEGDFYEKWFKDWMEHQKSVQESLSTKSYLVTTDIASYFENINILVLKDLVRSDVSGKNGVLNLLFYFLENTRFRYNYEVNTFNGLPQENIDCSRILAYYFLRLHDNAMAEFCKKYDAEFYRFVDDMSIAVNSEADGKWALKKLAESLRKLNLVSSIEKTSIMKSAEAKLELFFDENEHITDLERRIKEKLQTKQDVKPIIKEIKEYYTKLIKNKKESHKNWIKILKRFYSVFTYAKSDFFFGKSIEHLKNYPLLFSENKIDKYLLQNIDKPGFNNLMVSLIDYLYSQENLYPAIESKIIELFLLIEPKYYNQETKKRLKQLGEDIFFRKNSYPALSDYARALSCLLFYRFNYENLNKIVKHYLRTNEDDGLLQKYIIFISLTTDNHALRKKVINKAKTEQSLSINRLVNFVDKLSTYKTYSVVKDYLNKNKMIIVFDKDINLKIEQEFKPIRSEILKKIIDIYSENV